MSMFTGRKLASNPPSQHGVVHGGSGGPPAARGRHAQFLDLACYTGFGSVEFKWDRHKRCFVIIEPTVGRTDWQEELATLCGVNIPLAAVRFEQGLAPLPCTPRGKHIVWQASYLDPFLLGYKNPPRRQLLRLLAAE
ncbi:MAG TPA: hypothetical protein VKW08_04605 [Xanthobacteraceae bacterium]|nr:hypothetical protein [Xanthobacteraceae bacterium]